jgi:hypothetical protein
MLGSEVSGLVNGYLNTGEYNIKFDASGLPSGTYFYKLSALSKESNNLINNTRPMVLIK